MLKATGIFLCAILVTVMAGCVSDPAEDLLETEQAVTATGASGPAGATGEPEGTEAAGAIGGADAAAVGCSVVTTCNAVGPDGTRCRQQGCSLGAAVLECQLESFTVCGVAVCPVIFIRLDGTRQNLCRA
jgi:hypothetical protein